MMHASQAFLALSTLMIGAAPLDPAKFKSEIGGRPVALYTLSNPRHTLTAAVTNYGARIDQILFDDTDVVLGYDSLDAAQKGSPTIGAFIGRYANRIANGRFELEGKTIQLPINSAPHTIHGGPKGSRYAVFDARKIDAATLELTHTYQESEDGFPGDLDSKVTYRVTDDDALEIRYEARARDKTTVANFTSHPYFNLKGEGTILDQIVQIQATRYTPTDDTLIPTGEIASVAGTPFDFTSPTAIGARIPPRGYDLNYVLDAPTGTERLVATVRDPNSGRTLEVLTTEPGLQFFSGDVFTGTPPRDAGKGGQIYLRNAGLCLEPQHFPDSVNHPDFPSTVIRSGETYRGVIVYRFSKTP